MAMIKGGNFVFNSVICLLSLSAIAAAAAEKESEVSKLRRVYLPHGASLPEQFTNDRLPRKLDNAERCYNLIGCFEKIPITTLPQDPATFRTAFRIYSRARENGTVVSFDRIENCLPDSDNCDVYPYDLSLILNSSFNIRKRTIILIGGYFSKDPSQWEVRMKDLWLKLDDVNVIIVSWTGGNSGIYQTAAVNTRPVGRQLTVLLYYIAKFNGLDLSDDSFAEKIYIIGHSLGAHIAGFTGADLAGRIGRISGLEPAGPQFDSLDARFRLDKTDAQLVDVLHTNAGASFFLESQYGSALKSGHIDLYANDGFHQPGCSSDRLGCSHKKANHYYEAFLRHELAMRDYLPKSRPIYRLFAYASPSFDQFRNGSGLMKYCPITALDEDNLKSMDLPRCSVPIDYISWFDVYKRELEDVHGIDFHPNSINEKRYYFYTSEETNDQFDHYLLRVRASQKSADVSAKREGCDFSLDVSMRNGLDNKYKIEKYKLVDDKGELEMSIPFLSPNIITKYEIAKLDTNNFYLNDDGSIGDNNETIIKSLVRILPSSITITGMNINKDENDKNKGGVVDFFKRMFNMGKGERQNNPDNKKNYCNLGIEKMTIQPLRRFHRQVVGIYSAEAKDKPSPDIIVASNKFDKTTKREQIKSKATVEAQLNDINPKLYLDTVIFGPFDETIVDPPDDDDDSGIDDLIEAEPDTINTATSAMPYNGSPSYISANTWLTLTISMSMVIVIVALIATISTSRIDETDKRPFLSDQIQLE